MTLISVIFLMVIQAFNSMLLGSYLIDARTAVRNEGEFVGEYFKLRIKNADPRSITCPTDSPKRISWQSKGSSDSYTFFIEPLDDPTTYRFCMTQSSLSNPLCDTILTYADVKVRDVTISCETPAYNQAPISNVNLSFVMDSTAKLGENSAVRDVSRFINVSIR
ncbi:hypothetical protein CO112_02370 [Candidatus Dojkabacteria bacterium CG_4_9_14_3_um_filter_150_Dojkabacteria_WS6_41_13]|nr:MAG: hypothetical protein COZ14_02070 [Candidatus Dojkabacteria bacterium CG_4_10_14_3_um_filter_Dojkabacteria_WS6_41_9]PJB22820.1 MAG: hypothetical protein CO112_02370 [Candidatus Dojkabacteria bacterium CG_4_9_14_3_um_filter_150_Dojkabacteria_WS6_41_13]